MAGSLLAAVLMVGVVGGVAAGAISTQRDNTRVDDSRIRAERLQRFSTIVERWLTECTTRDAQCWAGIYNGLPVGSTSHLTFSELRTARWMPNWLQGDTTGTAAAEVRVAVRRDTADSISALVYTAPVRVGDGAPLRSFASVGQVVQLLNRNGGYVAGSTVGTTANPNPLGHDGQTGRGKGGAWTVNASAYGPQGQLAVQPDEVRFLALHRVESFCNPVTQYRRTGDAGAPSCPSGYTGQVVQQRDFACPWSNWSEWRTISQAPSTATGGYANQQTTCAPITTPPHQDCPSHDRAGAVCTRFEAITTTVNGTTTSTWACAETQPLIDWVPSTTWGGTVTSRLGRTYVCDYACINSRPGSFRLSTDSCN